MHRVGKGVEAGCPDAAREISAGLKRDRSRVHDIRRVVVAFGDVHDSAAVRDDESFEPPCAAQMILQQHLVGAGGVSVDGVVGTHDGLDVSVDHGGAEGGEVGFLEVTRTHVHVEAMSQRFGTAVHGKVFAGCDCLRMFGVGALHSGDESRPELACEKRVFAVGLLAASPSWIAEDVDIRRPVGDPVENATIAFTPCLIELRASLIGDHVAHLAQDFRIPRRSNTDRLRKYGRSAGARNAVQCLVPRLVFGDAEPRDSRCPVFELRRLLFERHPADEIVGACGCGLRSVAI